MIWTIVRPRPSPCASFSLSVRPADRPSVRPLARLGIHLLSVGCSIILPRNFHGRPKSNAVECDASEAAAAAATDDGDCSTSIYQSVRSPPSLPPALPRPTVGTHSCPRSPSAAVRGRPRPQVEAGGGRRRRRRQHVIMGGPGQAADETTCRRLRLPRPPSFPPFLSLPPRTTSRLPFLPSLSFFRPLRAISRSPRASGLGVSHVCPSSPLSPSLYAGCWAWPGQAGRRRRSLHHLVSPIFRLLAIYPPPPPRRSFSLSFPATDRRISRINQTPSDFGFRPVGRSVRVRLPDRSSDDDLAG